MLPSFRVMFLIFSLVLVSGEASSKPHATPAGVSTAPPVIVIGFVGGFVKHDAMAHSVVQVAAHLRQNYPSGVYAEVLENHRREEAHAEIVRFVDTDRDGTLSVEEKRNARIILYGHSWGASEVVTLASPSLAP